MKKTENVYITHVLFPWETFAAQSEREARERASGGDRWTEDFLREVRENVLRYANEPFFPPDEFKHAEFMNTSMRNSCLNDVYRLVPLHFREEVFAGVSFPIWNQGARGWFSTESQKARRRWRISCKRFRRSMRRGTMLFIASTAISARRKTATTARMKPFGAARFGI